ncbi:unnamed protein product, partial [Cladocopium goreaui]
EVQQQITRQLGVSSYCQVLFADDDPCEVRVALQSQVNDFDAELLSAAEEGAEQVEELLRHFQNPNCVDEMERTPLLIASKAGHLDAVRCLLEAQAEVNRSSAQGYTPVGVAAYRGDLEMLDSLVAAAADIEKASLRGFTALHGAAHGNSAAVIGRLLEVRANLERTTVRGKTALCIASEKGFSEVVRCLLDAGAEVEGCYEPSSTKKTAPLLAAAEQGHVEVVDLLLQRQAEVNRSSSRGFTALHAAAENGQVPVMPLSGKVNPWKMLQLCGDRGHLLSVSSRNGLSTLTPDLPLL